MQAKKTAFENDLRVVIEKWLEKHMSSPRSYPPGTLAFEIVALCDKHKIWDLKLIDETLDSVGRRDQATN